MAHPHALRSIKGFAVLTKTAKVDHLRATCECGQSFEGRYRQDALALWLAHAESHGFRG